MCKLRFWYKHRLLNWVGVMTTLIMDLKPKLYLSKIGRCLASNYLFYFGMLLFGIMYSLGRGINREGFNFKLAMVKTCSTWLLLNKYVLWKIFEVGLQTPSSPQTPYIAYGKGQKLKIWILLLPWSKCIHSNLKGIVIMFKQ